MEQVAIILSAGKRRISSRQVTTPRVLIMILRALGPRDFLVRTLRRILKERDIPIGNEPLQMRRTGDLDWIVAGHYDLYAF